jgi:PPM family protein phosphatase
MSDLQENEAGAVHTSATQGAREAQQDSVRVRWLAADQAWLIVLADGMGGHAAGDLASRIAVDTFVASFASLREKKLPPGEALRDALAQANRRIAEAQQIRPETAGMGTTLVGAHVSREGVRWISVGDSPLWLYHRARLTRLNDDHSLRHVDAATRGKASANLLTSALSGQTVRKIDLRDQPLEIPADARLLLASDGLLTLDEDAIATVMAAQPAPAQAGEKLIAAIDHAKQRHQDNCTVAIYAPGKRIRSGGSRTKLVFWGVALLTLGAAVAAATVYWRPILHFISR